MGTHPIFESDFDCLTEMARVFDLEQLIEPALLGCDKSRIHIESLCLCHDRLVVTTNDSLCHVFHCIPGAKPSQLGRGHLGLRKSIVKIDHLDESRALVLTADGVLAILSLDKVAIVTGKQSQLTGVSDFCVNRSSTDSSSFDFSVLISVAKKKALALVHISPTNAILPKAEFHLDETPVGIVCQTESALIRCTTHYKLLNLNSKQQQRLIDVSCDCLAPMAVIEGSNEFLLSGPGGLGVFIDSHGMPGRPPIQLTSNTSMTSSLGHYLATGDGEFLTVFGKQKEEEGNAFHQLQIIPIPAIKHVAYSESASLQMCCTREAVYQLSTLPFYSVAFHLLSQCEVEEALSEAEKAERSTPVGMSDTDVLYWVQRIQVAAAFISISIDKLDKAKRLFEISGSAWVDVLATFANAGFLDAEAFGESIAEDKYVRRCDAQSVRRFVIANSLQNLEKSGNALAAQIWLKLVISEDTPRAVFEAILAIRRLGIVLDWSHFIEKIEYLSDSPELVQISNSPTQIFTMNPNALALVKWIAGDFGGGLSQWIALSKKVVSDESFSGISFFGPLILEKIEDKNVTDLVLKALEELILIDVDWTIKIISAMKVDEIQILKRIKKSKEMKVKYLEFLASKGRKKKFIYEELVKEYLKDLDCDAMRKLLENNDYRKYVDLVKTLGEVRSKPKSKCTTRLEAEILCFQKEIKAGMTCLLENDDPDEAENLSLKFGTEATTILALLYSERGDTDRFRNFLSRHGKFIDGNAVLESAIKADAQFCDFGQFLAAILRESEQRRKLAQLKNALKLNEVSCSIEDFNSTNWKLERSDSDFQTSKCRVTGKRIGEDFYMYPAGYICLPSAAASPDVCPLTGDLLTPYKSIGE